MIFSQGGLKKETQDQKGDQEEEKTKEGVQKDQD